MSFETVWLLRNAERIVIVLFEENDQRRWSGVTLTILMLIIFLYQHILKCFTPVIPQQFDNEYNLYYLQSSMSYYLSIYSYL